VPNEKELQDIFERDDDRDGNLQRAAYCTVIVVAINNSTKHAQQYWN